MSNNNKTETGSPDIIEDIIPGKNNDYTDKSINPNNNQQSFVENYNEEESAQAVIEGSEEPKQSLEKNTDKAADQISLGAQAITYTQEQTAQATRKIAGNSLEMQKQVINSFQSIFMPSFQNFQNQLWNNQGFFTSMSEMYFRLVNNYIESAIAFSNIINDVAFSNISHFRNAINEAMEQSKHLTKIGETNVRVYEELGKDVTHTLFS